MVFLDFTLTTPAENLALDEAFLLEAEAGRGGEVLRIWEWSTPAVVLGSGCKLKEDVKEAACIRDGVPILRRASGGGTVLLGSGCLVYSLVLRYDRAAELQEIRSSYEHIFGQIIRALSDKVPGIEPVGISDLALRGRKFSGNSQQRKRDHLLHHGTILYAFSLKQVEEYLLAPARQPEYRQGREHEAFLCNLPMRREELIAQLRTAWGADEASDAWPVAVVQQLVSEKYGSTAWVRRR
jgi:lipoate-protein ligase A